MPKKSSHVDRALTSHGARNALRERIRHAFGKAVRPALDRIVEVDWDWRADPERAGIVEAFGGKEWWAIDIATAEAHYSALSFFAPEAFRYYLPAFLMACLATHARPLPATACAIRLAGTLSTLAAEDRNDVVEQPGRLRVHRGEDFSKCVLVGHGARREGVKIFV